MFSNRVMGPEFPLINKIQNYYLKNILIKTEKNLSIKQTKDVVINIIEDLFSNHNANQLKIIIDVDPM
ncbi:MAG: hypothetical protein HC906_08410 [Bacteroidales bacterium]|nr:hypothetical protein [Bacteroidales bacterium]